jgi:sulfite reductase alpha subunit
MDITHSLTMHFQNDIHRPSFPYKFKVKCSGCPNDCAAASARSDLAIIGIWRDSLQIDQEEVRQAVASGFAIVDQVTRRCPTECLEWNVGAMRLEFDADECVHCMHCVNQMPKAIRVGRDRGAALLIGGKAPVVKGAIIGWVLVPFMKMEPPYDELKQLITRMTDFWAETGKNRERLAEMIDRIGMAAFLEAMGLKPLPQMVSAPRANPYLFWRTDEIQQPEEAHG